MTFEKFAGLLSDENWELVAESIESVTFTVKAGELSEGMRCLGNSDGDVGEQVQQVHQTEQSAVLNSPTKLQSTFLVPLSTVP